jgi:hypothetical protein
MTGTEEFLEGVLESPGLRIVHRDEVRLGVRIHLDPLHLRLVHKDIERGLGQQVGRSSCRVTVSVHAGPVGAANGPGS